MTVAEHLPALEREIEALLAPTATLPGRDALERTLTTGYAHALRLEGERLDAEARLRALVRGGAAGDVLTAASGDVSRVEAELRRLRALLATLRARL
ncbi:MAG TPA: hypothetical protein VNT58_02695 [Gaiellaceae bacterium]|nr:hypothetical protein [Gaiellaceae bacterium]